MEVHLIVCDVRISAAGVVTDAHSTLVKSYSLRHAEPLAEPAAKVAIIINVK
jgi:hypothetical protein